MSLPKQCNSCGGFCGKVCGYAMPLTETEADTKIATLEDLIRIAALNIDERDYVIKCAIDFIEQNELQGSRMEVAEYDTLVEAVEPFIPDVQTIKGELK